MAKTPLMAQYKQVKDGYKDCLLFYRLGDFYELFYDDAITASHELELTLTGKNAGPEGRVPMCGIPFHAAEIYIYRLIQKGYKVAICEQLEDPKKAKGLVKRDVIRVITPGTILFENSIADKSNNYLIYIMEGDKEIDAVLADVSTGECWWGVWDKKKEKDDFFDMLSVYSPAEAICAVSDEFYGKLTSFCAARLGACLMSRSESEEEGDIPPAAASIENDNVQLVFRRLSAYLKDVMKTEVASFHSVQPMREDHTLTLSEECLRNLEITRNMRDGGRKGTLLELLDYTHTAMGARLLKRWLERPLTDVNRITLRQNGIEELTTHMTELTNLEDMLSQVFDFERILGRIEANSTSPKDLLALKASLKMAPQIKNLLAGAGSVILKKLNAQIGIHGPVYDLLDRSMNENGTGNIRDGKYIKEGFSSELDEVRSLSENSQKYIADLEEREKEKTGIKLKIGFNNVFGYYFEISNANKIPVPAYYMRKQTLVNAERYITPELKEFEAKALTAKEKTEELELKIYQAVKAEIRPEIPDMQKTARALAQLDCLSSLARAALKDRYVKPQITNAREGRISIKDGRHPMVEHALKREMFVPNDTELNHNDQEILVITGPNMAGKSTYMRQVAVLTIMAQVGSFIPARSASFSPVDRIFTRVGASDDISTGQSTFMVEMQEVSHILRNATKNSLILLDEIGRGTSTYDGMSIARAVVEYIDEKIHGFTLFATHYHELSDMADHSSHIKNYTVTVKERGKDITFLRRIVPGCADRSYGIHVARLAGLPESLLKRADDILQGLEEKDGVKPTAVPAKQGQDSPMGMDLFTSPIIDELANMDVMSKTPIEAMEILFRLSKEAKEGR
ncbi:DNA mismatch repair protein MutS [uncultured Dialister sp.]|mgnify:FL=1|jgi:DNA mismatch repair protein MutS|uniref:DNA mismatch repair protein MutS n=1 Tax=uncultured Dialister sp. TaxID=278064 RepID=UPI0025F3A2A3|nr:DNA mismatch repair protein MutS [uncultured Dialister sp.]